MHAWLARSLAQEEEKGMKEGSIHQSKQASRHWLAGWLSRCDKQRERERVEALCCGTRERESERMRVRVREEEEGGGQGTDRLFFHGSIHGRHID